MPVPGFSKALHGTALLRPALAVPLPAWCPQGAAPVGTPLGTFMASSLERDRIGLEEPGDRDARAVRVAEHKASGDTPPAAKPAAKPEDAPKPAAKPKVMPAATQKAAPKPVTADTPLRCDKKTPMANERTLLRWLRSAVLLAGMSALLSSYPATGAQINGMLLAVLAIVFVFAPLRSYRQRSRDMSDPSVKKPRQ